MRAFDACAAIALPDSTAIGIDLRTPAISPLPVPVRALHKASVNYYRNLQRPTGKT